MVRYLAVLFTGLLCFCSTSLFGAFAPSEWDSYCRRCHIERPVNSLYDASIKAHANASLSCVSCHKDKGIAGHARKSAALFARLFEDMTLPPDVRPQNSSSAASDTCLGCHFYIFDVDEIAARKTPKSVRSIKLRAAHRQHWDYRAMTPSLEQKRKILTAEKEKSFLSKTDRAELDRLSRIEKMQCSRCHARFKKDRPGGTDPNVNIAMKNPMECTACHIALRASVHPGGASPFPSAVACDYCHHGKLHQKIVFFPVDRGTDADCLSCHPGYTRDAIAAVEPGQFVHKSTDVRTTVFIKSPK